MASQNTLLGSGVETQPKGHGHEPLPPQKNAPAWRYHKDFLEGKIFKTDEELVEADLKGWVDHIGKLRLLPGHDKIWEAQKTLESGKTNEVQATEKESIEKAETLKIEDAAAKIEEKYKKDYEESKNPIGSHTCTLCGKTFETHRALNMHGLGAHRNREKGG